MPTLSHTAVGVVTHSLALTLSARRIAQHCGLSLDAFAPAVVARYRATGDAWDARDTLADLAMHARQGRGGHASA